MARTSNRVATKSVWPWSLKPKPKPRLKPNKTFEASLKKSEVLQKGKTLLLLVTKKTSLLFSPKTPRSLFLQFASPN
jgi:hypothetical protein